MDKIEKLFDYQKFENDPELAKVTERVEEEYLGELSEDDLDAVTAAGNLTAKTRLIKPTSKNMVSKKTNQKMTAPKSLPTRKGTKI